VSRLAIIGLDCADPILLEELLPELPTLRRLVSNGSFSRLRSIDPPITVPAWMCMMTGKDPGELGVYGFENRTGFGYAGFTIPGSSSFRAETLWDTLGRHGRRSVLLGIPGTFPPRPIHGCLVAGFLTPTTRLPYTFPASLADEIRGWVGAYDLDVREFRTDDVASTIDQARTMTRKRFAVARHLVKREPWDLFAMVEIGPDRIHHALWAHHHPDHLRHDPASPFIDALADYYRLLDAEIGALLDVLPNSSRILVVSDHGAQSMAGGIGLNEWLIAHGYLVVQGRPAERTRLQELIEQDRVDWSRTTAWGSGGYCGRLYLNVAGREPKGIVAPGDVSRVLDELATGIEAIPDESGAPIGTRVLRPERVYRTVRGIPPDLLVYFGDLQWRSIGTVGWNRIHFRENDTGPDAANHALDGIYISSPADNAPGDRSILEIRDVVLAHLGIEKPQSTDS